ncbi:unnamed protein product [Gongylonema pulchrum]|uniref:AMP-binding_C domain-containing protein n=1 Tax=Gongylonema pulchrum TaxID=637853 RepID=A0A183D654_9BILA|nr:unnamed protein product [Gongylonema pulchrum]
MIKVRGWQVSPYEIEEAVQSLPEVEICAVIGVPDEASGKFASYKQLKGGIEFISNMPLTGSGKVARTELLRMHNKRRTKLVDPAKGHFK